MPERDDRPPPQERPTVFIERPYTGVGVMIGTDHPVRSAEPIAMPKGDREEPTGPDRG